MNHSQQGTLGYDKSFGLVPGIKQTEFSVCLKHINTSDFRRLERHERMKIFLGEQ